MISTLKEYPNGGKIDVYDIVDQEASDFLKVFACCEYFAAQGKYTLITPSFRGDTARNPIYMKIYASLMGTPYWTKCPDFLVDGVWYEHEGYDTNKDFSNPRTKNNTFFKMLALCAAHVITRGIKQSARLIVEDCGVSRREAKKNIYNRVHEYKQNIKEVYIRAVESLDLLYICADGSQSKKRAG